MRSVLTKKQRDLLDVVALLYKHEIIKTKRFEKLNAKIIEGI